MNESKMISGRRRLKFPFYADPDAMYFWKEIGVDSDYYRVDNGERIDPKLLDPESIAYFEHNNTTAI